MSALDHVFSVSAGPAQSAEPMRARWQQPAFQAIAGQVRTAIARGSDLPVDLPVVERLLHGHPIKLVDLQGIDLSGCTFGDVDLSYCAFDFADMSDSRFSGTRLQNSSFYRAVLDKVEWNRVQASPISAPHASFQSARISASYLMGSNLAYADFTDARLRRAALAGSWAPGSRIFAAAALDQVDVTAVSLPRPPTHREFLLPGLVGEPCWLDDVRSQPHQHRLFYGRELIATVVSGKSQGYAVVEFAAAGQQAETLQVKARTAVEVGDRVLIAPRRNAAATVKSSAMRKKRRKLAGVHDFDSDVDYLRWAILRVLGK